MTRTVFAVTASVFAAVLILGLSDAAYANQDSRWCPPEFGSCESDSADPSAPSDGGWGGTGIRDENGNTAPTTGSARSFP